MMTSPGDLSGATGREPRRRVAVTGLGIISCLGRGRETTSEALRGARSGITAISGIDTEGLSCRIAGQIPAGLVDGRVRGHDRFTRLALIAAEEAIRQAGDLALPPDRIGVLLGTGMGGCETLDEGYRRLYREGARIPPMSIPMSMYNAAPSAVSAAHGARGPSWSVVSACASSAHAIGLAADAIRSGRAEAMITGGSDAPLTPGVIRAWEALRILAAGNDEPAEACRPFSTDRRGLVLAEGAAILVLEELEHARRRGAAILAEIAGFGFTSDAAHVTDPSADGAAHAMRLALGDAGLAPGDIGYVNAHGTATRANDPTEARAIRAVFGGAAPPVSSTKSMHGHAMGASGAIEITCSILALREGFLPPTINLSDIDPECDLDHVANHPRQAKASAFLSNSFGFGGLNAVVAVRLP